MQSRKFIAGTLAVFMWLAVAVPAFAGEPIVATFWYSYGGKVREVTEEMVKRFNSSQTKYRIDGSFQGDYFQALAKIRAAIPTKTAPAIFHAIGEALPDLWQGGMLENLEPYVKATGMKTEDFVQALSQHGYFEYYGKQVPLFAIPFNRSMPVMYYNKDLLDAKGVKVPTTWDEFVVAADKIQKAGFIALAHGGQPWQDATLFESIALSAGGAASFAPSRARGAAPPPLTGSTPSA